jgi:hypothetical protein
MAFGAWELRKPFGYWEFEKPLIGWEVDPCFGVDPTLNPIMPFHARLARSWNTHGLDD